MSYRETEHLRVLIANERRDRLAIVAPIVAGLGHEVIAREIDVGEVGAVTASDPDPGQSLIYAIIAGNTTGTFQINPNTGQITVADNSKLTVANSPYNLTVKVTDDATRPASNSATVTVNVVV